MSFSQPRQTQASDQKEDGMKIWYLKVDALYFLIQDLCTVIQKINDKSLNDQFIQSPSSINTGIERLKNIMDNDRMGKYLMRENPGVTQQYYNGFFKRVVEQITAYYSGPDHSGKEIFNKFFQERNIQFSKVDFSQQLALYLEKQVKRAPLKNAPTEFPARIWEIMPDEIKQFYCHKANAALKNHIKVCYEDYANNLDLKIADLKSPGDIEKAKQEFPACKIPVRINFNYNTLAANSILSKVLEKDLVEVLNPMKNAQYQFVLDKAIIFLPEDVANKEINTPKRERP